jgi:cell division protein ZapE
VTPSALYARGVQAGRWQADPAQEAALRALDELQAELLAAQPDSLWEKFSARFRDASPVRGLYLWGSVGRGKTLLTDLLLESLPGLPKRRWHFHRFMVEVHARLKALPDTADTLSVVAKDLAGDLRLLLLDEFFVADIADAMILGRLLERLFAHGVTLVTTSNIEPTGLYKDGLQRARFLPTIALLERHCRVLRLDRAHDYRLRELTRAETYLTPVTPDTARQLEQRFEQIAAGAERESSPLRVNGRDIPALALAEGLAWFEFAALCEGARAAPDYIEIARDFHTVFVSAVPHFDGSNEDAALRFVHLVDELYDRNVNLLLSAAAEPTALYAGRRHGAAFERTASRLIEMRSHDYLAREHRP